jgi:polyisoprenoid-binding protein YceI
MPRVLLIIDPDHSSAAFSVRHMMLANVRGLFGRVTGTISLDEEDPGRSSVDVHIDVGSVTTGIRKRDEHLLTSDFFDAANHPGITFRSTSVEMTGERRAWVRGNLTIRGTSRSVTIQGEAFGPVKSPFGATSMGFTGRTVIDRYDFGVSWNEPLERGGLMVGKDVFILLDLEADYPAGESEKAG